MPGWQRGDSNWPYSSLGAGGTCGDALADAEAVNARLEAVNAHAAMRLQMRRFGPSSGAIMGHVRVRVPARSGRGPARSGRGPVGAVSARLVWIREYGKHHVERMQTHRYLSHSPRPAARSSAG